MTVQDRQHPRAQDVGRLGCVRAHIAQRTAPDPVLEQPGGVQVLGKKRQLPACRRAASLVPANLEHASRRTHPHVLPVPGSTGRDQGLLTGLGDQFHGKFLLTHLAPSRTRAKPAPSLRFRHFALGQLRKMGSIPVLAAPSNSLPLHRAGDTCTWGKRTLLFGALMTQANQPQTYNPSHATQHRPRSRSRSRNHWSRSPKYAPARQPFSCVANSGCPLPCSASQPPSNRCTPHNRTCMPCPRQQAVARRGANHP